MVTADPGRFHFSMMSSQDAYDYAKRSIEIILQHGNPATKFLITTSPIPLKLSSSGEDILIANTYGKSVLRSVCGELAAAYDHDYFPSFETAMLTKSSSIWEDDLIHLTEGFVNRIVERLGESYFPTRLSIAAAG